MPQFGDEHMQAAGVEEAVVSPEVEQYILGVDHLVTVLARRFSISDSRWESSTSVSALGEVGVPAKASR